MITQSFEDMLYLFGAGAIGEKVEFNHEINIEEIRRLAVSQGIWQTVYLALPKNNQTVAKHKNTFLRNITENILRNEFTIDVIDNLESCGINCLMLKGMTVAKLYKEPSCRISGDMDIYIDNKHEKEAMKILAKLGYDVQERGRNSHHFLATHPTGGLLEVHIEMYSGPTKDILFEGKLNYDEERMYVEVDGGHKVKTFSVNDGAVYMTAHYIKHFISKGVGVRQLMDLLLYLNSYADKIDWTKYYTTFKGLKYEKLIRTLLAIGNKYFQMMFENADYECVDMILEDTERGGVFGYNNKGIDGFYKVFTQKRTDMTEREYNRYMYNKTNPSFFRKIFPLKTIMIKQGYQVRNGMELLVRYVQRLWVLIFSGMKSNEIKHKLSYNPNDVQINKEILDRMNMMEKLQVL